MLYFLLFCIFIYYCFICCGEVRAFEEHYNQYELYIRNGIDYDIEDSDDEAEIPH